MKGNKKQGRGKDDREVIQLILKARAGNSLAVKKLLMHYAPLIMKVVRIGERKLRNLGIIYDRYELESEAHIGFFNAIKKFDPTKGMKFSTYAFNWMKTLVLRYVEKVVKEFMKVYDAEKCKQEEEWEDTDSTNIIDRVAKMNRDKKLCPELEEFLMQRFEGKKMGRTGKKDDSSKKEK